MHIEAKSIIVYLVILLLVTFRDMKSNTLKFRIKVSIYTIISLSVIFTVVEQNFNSSLRSLPIYSGTLLLCLTDYILTKMSMKLHDRDFHSPTESFYSDSYFGSVYDDKPSDFIFMGILIALPLYLTYLFANLVAI